MNLESYPYSSNDSSLIFEFDSRGSNGVIRKVARFGEIDVNIYNFSFGDLKSGTSDINDTSVSNNGDSAKVLATAAMIIIYFTEKIPQATIFIKGSSLSRTRLYQMGLSKHWEEIINLFEVLGYRSGRWERFQKGINYEAFLARRIILF